jgi:hypothetical protein
MKTALTAPQYMSEQATAVLAFARKCGATNLEKLMLSSRAAMPSVAELNAELGGNFFEQVGDALVIHDPDHAAA